MSRSAGAYAYTTLYFPNTTKVVSLLHYLSLETKCDKPPESTRHKPIVLYHFDIFELKLRQSSWVSLIAGMENGMEQ